MAKQARTRADELRHLASLATRKYDDARTAWEAFSEEIEVVRTAAEEMETADLSSISNQVSVLSDALQALAAAGANVDGMEAVMEAVDALTNAEVNLGVDGDALTAFAETYEELENTLDEFENTRDTDRYEGKRDDMETAWTEVTEKMEALADAADALGFDWTPASAEVDNG